MDTLDEAPTALITYLNRGSIREYARVLKAHKLPSKSPAQIGRDYRAASYALLKRLRTRSLEGVNLAAIMLDGTPVGNRQNGKRTIVWALGITMDGTKIPLGIEEGETETGDVAYKLLSHLVADCELDISDAVVCTDGGPQLLSAIKRITRGRPAVQRCQVHKSRNVVIDNLLAAERKEIGSAIRHRLWKAWIEPDPDKAHARLTELSQWLDSEGHPNAAKSVLEGAEMTLTLRKLGVVDRAVLKALSSTNAIESVHNNVSRWKRRWTHWTPAADELRNGLDDIESSDRQRCVVAAIANAEESWDRVAARRSKFERMQLAGLKRRHLTVELKVTNAPGVKTLMLERVRVAPELRPDAEAALSDLLRWVDRNGKVLEVAPGALQTGLVGAELAGWLESNGCVARDAGDVASAPAMTRAARRPGERGGSRRAHARERDASKSDVRGRDRDRPGNAGDDRRWPGARDRRREDPLERFRDVVGEELLVSIGELALTVAPDVARMSPRELQAAIGQFEVAREGAASVETGALAWWRKNWKRAPWRVAFEQREHSERSGRHALAGRWRVLGEQRALWVLGEAARAEGWIEESLRLDGSIEPAEADREKRFLHDEARSAGGVFDDLDRLAGQVKQAATVVAAEREVAWRRQLDAVHEQVGAAGMPGPADQMRAREDLIANPLNRYQRALGERRCALLARYAEQRRGDLEKLDDATLHTLRHEIGDAWQKPDATSWYRTVRLEAERNETARQRMATMRELGRWQRQARAFAGRPRGKAAQDRAVVCSQTATTLWAKLRANADQLAAERTKASSLDSLVMHHPEAGVDASIQGVLERRMGLEPQPQTREPSLGADAAEQASPEPAAGVGM